MDANVLTIAPGADEAMDRLATAGFDELFDATWSRVYTYAWLLLRHRQDAEDVAAEAYERAYRSWRAGRRPSGNPVPWLLVIARRLVIDRDRRRRLVTFRSLEGTRERAVDDQEMRNSEAAAWFDSVRRALPPRQFEVLLLRFQYDLATPEIGAVMHLSEAGVRTLVHRALAELRQHPEVLRP